jgi:hypothetical protein
MRTKTATILAAATFLLLTASASAQAPIANQSELRRSVHAAATPADHARIAAYYRESARSYAGKQAEEERIAAQWQRQYENWSKTPNPYRSAKNLAAYYKERAGDALARAAEQERLAGN